MWSVMDHGHNMQEEQQKTHYPEARFTEWVRAFWPVVVFVLILAGHAVLLHYRVGKADEAMANQIATNTSNKERIIVLESRYQNIIDNLDDIKTTLKDLSNELKTRH